jgi:hypothetical protein
VRDPDAIRRIVGDDRVRTRATVNACVKLVSKLLAGPLPVKEHVRCRQCGYAIDELPCVHCAAVSEKYDVVRDTPAAKRGRRVHQVKVYQRTPEGVAGLKEEEWD